MVLAGLPVPASSHLLPLADGVAILIDPKHDVLEQVEDVFGIFRVQRG
jgi:hypothetical protein